MNEKERIELIRKALRKSSRELTHKERKKKEERYWLVRALLSGEHLKDQPRYPRRTRRKYRGAVA